MLHLVVAVAVAVAIVIAVGTRSQAGHEGLIMSHTFKIPEIEIWNRKRRLAVTVHQHATYRPTKVERAKRM